MQIELTTYTIGEQFACYFVYGETDSLSDEEQGEIDSFENGITRFDKPEGFHFGHWDITDETEEFSLCEVTDLRGRCVKVNAVWIKD